jgi:hypothetical protein
MNRDPVKGAAKWLAGTLQVAGRAQKGRGDITKTIKDYKEDHPAN